MLQHALAALVAGKTRIDLRPPLVILLFFFLFFAPILLTGRHFVGGDALVYSYPLRTAAWEMIRHGQWPLWTPLLLSGYPLLSMAQLGLSYPLTWGYLFLPGYIAEEVYVYAPFLLSPLFSYVYLRGVGRSRAAALLGGLSFGYGGMMAGGLSHNGLFTNAVMWLPLLLLVIERARQWKLGRALVCAVPLYALSVLTGLGQGFLYAGIIALAYAFCLSLTQGAEPLRWFSVARWRPLLVGVGGIALGAGLAAFQILETLRVQRRSIRSTLDYETFSAGAFTPKVFWQSFIAPLYHFNYEMTAYVPLLAAIFALVALSLGWRAPQRDWRIWFWGAVALVGGLLMLGDNGPLYRLLFQLPLVKLFRVAWRHAFEWSLGVGMLAAFGFDAARHYFQQTAPDGKVAKCCTVDCTVCGGFGCLPAGAGGPNAEFSADRTGDGTASRRANWLGYAGLSVYLALTAWAIRLGLQLAPGTAGTPALAEKSWLWWKVSLAVFMLVLLWWSWRKLSQPRRWVQLAVICSACFAEQQILFNYWCFPALHTKQYFTSVAPSTAFLQRWEPTQNRVYTSTPPAFKLELPKTEPHNLSARSGLHNAAGYEPLLLRRYADAFGSGLMFGTPALSTPPDAQILQPNWRVFDLLNVKLVAAYNAPPSPPSEKDGVLFTAFDQPLDLRPGQALTLGGARFKADGLSLVTSMANSGDIPQGAVVAKLIVQTTAGQRRAYELKAGVDTAEWAHERADVKANIQHSLARIFASQPGDAQNSFPSHRYWTNVALNEPEEIEYVVLQSQTERASLVVWRAGLYNTQQQTLTPLSARLPEHWQKVYEADEVTIYENKRALPRLWLVPQAEAVTPEEALKRIRGESAQPFDPRTTALLEIWPGALPRELRPAPDNLFFTQTEARMVSYEPNRLVIEAQTYRPAVLVVSEVHYSGWAASIDGKEAPIYATDYLLRGLILPAGKHRVELRYTAPGARSGAVISLAVLLLLSVIWIKSRSSGGKL